jgi:pyrimidine-nucleoside phosphorylase
MKTEAQATALAELMVSIGRLAGRRLAAVISDMNQPLGNAVGNTLEVIEAIETLKGHGPKDFVEHCLAVAEQMLLLAGMAKTEAEARDKLQDALGSGRALIKFGEWIQAQGGTPRVVHDYVVMPRATIIQDVLAPRDGFIAGIDAEEVGLTVVDLGGGRAKKEDMIDHSAGVIFKHKVGARVTQGDPLLTLHASDRSKFDRARERLLKSYTFSDTEPTPPPLIHQVIR